MNYILAAFYKKTRLNKFSIFKGRVGEKIAFPYLCSEQAIAST
jgi:hypothetical protein